MFDCLSEIKIIGFETYFYFSHQPQFSLLLQAASETACWIVESMISQWKYNNDYLPHKTDMHRLEFIPKGLQNAVWLQ